MTNIIEAICNIVENPVYEIKAHYSGRNRANNVGEALENYIKDSFAGTHNTISEEERNKIYSEHFSWLGNQNHPPDIMIKGGDAIEVKKTQSARSDLALNSSYPKHNISSDSQMITQDCRDCENWKVKDLIYCVGHTTDDSLKSLWMVYGDIYAAKHEVYQRIKNTISSGIEEIPDVEFAETKELGRVNRVDPLGITNLRIRGMWQIQNPRRVFEYIHQSENVDSFELIALIPKSKYSSFPDSSVKRLLSLKTKGLNTETVSIKNPNNPAQLIKCELVVYRP